MTVTRFMLKSAILAVFFSMSLIPIAKLAVYADANPNNHGHHYGQLKHHPAPVPPPIPAPIPAPIPNPPPPSVVTIVQNPAATLAPAAKPAPPGGALSLPAGGNEGLQPQRVIAAVPGFRDRNLWLVEALLPPLAIVWLMLLGSARSRRTTADVQPG